MEKMNNSLYVKEHIYVVVLTVSSHWFPVVWSQHQLLTTHHELSPGFTYGYVK